MPLFACEECGCIENTAVSNYWTRDAAHWPLKYRGKKLCSEHGPPFMIKPGDREEKSIDETDYGKWHGKFPKQSAVGMMVDGAGCLWTKEQVTRKQYGRGTTIVGEILEDGSVKLLEEKK